MASEKKETTDRLSSENEVLRAELAMLRGRMNACRQANIGATLVESRPASYLSSKEETGNSEGGEADMNAHLSIVVLGASGDLAVKKTYPALFALYRHKLLPKRFTIVGYARSELAEGDFRKKVAAKFPDKFANLKDEFLQHCWYHQGQYDSVEDFRKLNTELSAREAKDGGKPANRIFYMAIPPTAFIPSAKSIKAALMTDKGWNRVIVEKPFGKDLESSNELNKEMSALFSEDQLYRIDHYLGKEMVQNLMVLRFANKVFEPLWNRDHINCIQITFKEDFGTQGRGGYFDSFGIIRDVMQNHLLQMLSLVAMEPPLSLSAEDVRDEKVKLLRSIAPITVEDTVIGQYTADPKGKEPGYLDDKDVPKDSVTPTYAACVLHINNSRWMGIPWIVKCGKALNEKKAEIRIQFKYPVNTLFDDVSPNELVLRVGPDELMYLKMTAKEPGLDGGNRHTELDLTYKQRFHEEMRDLPDAYERLLLDVMRGDHNLFVRSDELAAAWRIFTPLLHKIEKDKALKPIKYAFGSRGPKEADQLTQRYGYIYTEKYKWESEKPRIGSPAPAGPTPAASSGVRAEPPVLAEFLKLVESPALTEGKADPAAFAALFTPDGVVESPLFGVKPAAEFYKAFLPLQKGAKVLCRHKLIDPAQSQTVAVQLAVEREQDGKVVHASAVDMIELAEEGKKIKKITVFFAEGPKAKL